MRFFLLDYIDYSTDQLIDAANPIERIWTYAIPRIRCSVCRSGWGGRRQSYLKLPDGFNDGRFYMPGALKDSDWFALVSEARSIFGVEANYKFEPGDNLGIPEYLVRPSKSDFLFHIAPILVQSHVVECIESGGLTGVKAVKIQARWDRRVKDKSALVPDLHALNVEGKGWSPGVDLNSMTVCDHCGRRAYKTPIDILVDESRWDGSDMFIHDLNPSYVIITEKAKDLFEQRKFTNCRFIPVESTGA
jgi:hypothetical protein